MASGSTSGLGALYGTGYDGAFAAWDHTRLNLNDAAFRAAMNETSTGTRLVQTGGGFWRGLVGDTRNVFETPAPLIELGNQYRACFRWRAGRGAVGTVPSRSRFRMAATVEPRWLIGHGSRSGTDGWSSAERNRPCSACGS